MKSHKSQFSITMGDFNAKVGTKKAGETSVWNFEVGKKIVEGSVWFSLLNETIEES